MRWYAGVASPGQLTEVRVYVEVEPLVETETDGALGAEIGLIVLAEPLASQALVVASPTQRACCWKVYFRPWIVASVRFDPPVQPDQEPAVEVPVLL